MVATMLLLLGQTPQAMTFDVNGVKREALIVRPARPSASTPLVFVFHGHMGNMNQTRRSMPVDRLWPEAMVVYPQGLPTKGMTDPEGKYNGWQQREGDYDDRDIAFFDVMMKTFRTNEKFDNRRVYSMGHSNGARMTHLLWNTRGETFAAIGASASPGTLATRRSAKIPVFIVAGEKDSIIPFRAMEFTISQVRQRLGTDPNKAQKDGYTTLEPGPNGLELGTYIFPGDHSIPKEATEQVVAFFKRH